MNIFTFREKVMETEDYQEKLEHFKKYIENNLAQLYKDREIDKNSPSYSYDNWSDEEKEEFDDAWNYLGSTGALELFNEMGWDYHEYVKNKSISYSILADECYLNCRFLEVWEEIKKCNVIDFCYAMIIVSRNVIRDSSLSKYTKAATSIALEKFGLSKIKDLMQRDETPTVFIAMSFDSKMRSARRSIESAIKNSGYKPMIIDMKEHNNQIVPEIFHEIKRSLFVIADLTNHRNGVYYEAGYAEALEKEVILTCRATDFESRHFDVSQKNTITWSDEEELLIKLEKRIEATVGKRN